MAVQSNENLVFGVIEVDERNATVFIKETLAIENAQAYEAASKSQTWGEFRASCPPALLEEIEEILDENEELHEDDEEFCSGDVPGLSDGYWPAFPQREQLSWFPKDLADKYGNIVSTRHDGDMLQIVVENQEHIVRELVGRGYQCTRDDVLVTKACGY
jgi:hypothetical protein